MFELILNVFINRYASGGSSMLAGESNQGTVENFISHEEVVKDSSIVGSKTNIKKNLTAKEKKRLRDQKYRQKKATCAPVVGCDAKTYLTPVEKKRLCQKNIERENQHLLSSNKGNVQELIDTTVIQQILKKRENRCKSITL